MDRNNTRSEEGVCTITSDFHHQHVPIITEANTDQKMLNELILAEDEELVNQGTQKLQKHVDSLKRVYGS